jgi:hypothetical protein
MTHRLWRVLLVACGVVLLLAVSGGSSAAGTPCEDACWAAFSHCIAIYGPNEAACYFQRNACLETCYPNGCSVPGFGTIEDHDFGAVAVGGRVEWERHFRNKYDHRCALHLSWSVNASDPWWESPAQEGPYRFTKGQEFHLKDGEHQVTAVEFAPTQEGEFRICGYYWWYDAGDSHWHNGSTIRYRGVGVQPGSFAPAPGETNMTTRAEVFPQPVAGWHHSDVVVELDAVPGRAPVRSIFYSLSGAQQQAGRVIEGAHAEFVVSAEGVTTITYFGIDTFNNPSPQQTLTVRIDKFALAGWVFIDLNRDGVRQWRERAGLARVRLNLTRDGEFCASTVSTPPSGWYEFVTLPAGRYCLSMDPPADRVTTTGAQRCFTWAGPAVVSFGVEGERTLLPLTVGRK